ncbi:RNA polymerase, sigma 54 subunit, RpoN/SigL [Halobacillus karajensis]|uniref:RNA polymerase sigma-54 factor 1 n=1 Tax=Halobacillus karajensis TaxID=195088 RepID=A0A059NYP3_9BACI|nr:RNA polymerase factor sigma-54 [Halobacillus karajensis]CDQ18577.1 RNA polymerase sigma-54 factor 1 [Halobacillus karajensis]CDQ23351.1 RNA polymerase sigma-54 factor 1 [Halobacillus karajensis]CDQ26833.1 RNA polymerase sigma-54 factor 1 [Halobacillus karajensis]SEH49666.1 RNA polymerase, sigma 54 subunit, RpoN/SigL [Halobacillus karajensis]
MKLELTHKQTTGLVMTTEMRQAIKMLQWTSADVWEYLQREVNENPILSIESSNITPYDRGNKAAYHDPIDYIASNHKDWRDELVEQTAWLKVEASLKEALLFLIGNLNEQGFCTISEVEAAQQTGQTIETINRARRLLIQFEPMGVGCLNFKEFLLFQVEDRYPDSPLLTTLIMNHLEDLASEQFGKVSQELEVEERQVKEGLAMIKTLDPRPVLPSQGTGEIPVMPDLILEKKEGGYLLRDPFKVNQQMKWDEQLVQMYKEGKQAQEYLDGCFKRASWLFKSIEQRQQTIMKVAELIIQHQKEFFHGGTLKPFTLKKAAQILGVHESTVSRTVANKVMQTPMGTLELKSFFVTGYRTEDGDEVSSQHLKELIKEMISKEEPLNTLSDQKIAMELMRKHNVRISRRTVAKYRESLSIPSSSKRKAAGRERISPILLHS